MTYKKPKNVSYTDMCIYIDNHIYTDDCEHDKVYEYLYHIINMLAYKRAFFNKSQYYDDFALISASRVYMRLTNPKQFELNENGAPKLSKIRSVLNYIKMIMYPMKVAFEQDNYAQSYSEKLDNDIINNPNTASIDRGSFISIEINDYLKSLPKVIYQYLLKIPKKKYSSEWLNIYTSCVLSLLKNFSLTSLELNRLESRTNLTDRYIEKLYSNDDVILYHLDPRKQNYIQILTRELKSYIYRELRSIVASYDIGAQNFNDIIYNSVDCLIEDEENFNV